MGSPARIEVCDVTVSYDAAPVLRRVGFRCLPGEIVGVVGPNGAGKTTLIKVVLGLLHPDSGHVRIDGQPAAARRDLLAYVPQRAEVNWEYPATVREVVAMGRYVRGRMLRRLRSCDWEEVDAALDQVTLRPHANAPIDELSGGQQQRMLLARALAQEAQILLLDEPFAGVDALTEEVLRDRLVTLRAQGATVLIVNHDLATVDTLSDKLLLLNQEVIAYGPAHQVVTAGNLRIAYGSLPRVLGGGLR